MSGIYESIIIAFVKGFNESKEPAFRGKKNQKKPQWVAFLSTDIGLQACTFITKYTKRWACDILFK